MAKRSNLNFDGKGYISNVGASKYWGVNKVSNGNQKWRVLVHAGSAHINPEDTVLHATAVGWDMTEEEAAWIAASFYETPAVDKNFVRSVPSKCGNYQYRVNANRNIHRVERELSDLFEMNAGPNVVRVMGFPVSAVTTVSPDEFKSGNDLASMATRLDPKNTEEMDFIKKMTGMILDKRGTPEFYNLMKNLTEIGAEYV